MTDPAIKAALEAAAQDALCRLYGEGAELADYDPDFVANLVAEAAAAIAAFLWEIRDRTDGGCLTVSRKHPVTISSTLELGALAAAVEAAARDAAP